MTGTPSECRDAKHLAPLTSTSFSLWRLAALRGTGFPFEWLEKLQARSTIAAIDRLAVAERELDAVVRRAASHIANRTSRKSLLRAGRAPVRLDVVAAVLGAGSPEQLEIAAATATLRAARDELESAFRRDSEEASANLAAIATSDLFRRALLWQNRHAAQWIAHHLSQRTGASSGRKYELAIASYLQRYCAKCDTIGFFGPVGWAEIDAEGPSFQLDAGTGLVRKSEVFLESWVYDAIASSLGEQPGLRRWLAPRAAPALRFDETRLFIPFRDPIELGRHQISVLAACDGFNSANAIAEAAVASGDWGSADEIFEFLALACQLGAIRWTWEVPIGPDPGGSLRAAIEQVGDQTERRNCTEVVTQIETARELVADSLNDGDRLDTALRELEEAVTRSTGASATRRSGETYAARTPAYLECTRDVNVRIGPAVLDRLGPPLSLILTSARWFTWQIAERYGRALRALFDTLSPTGAEMDLPVFYASLMKDRALTAADGLPVPVQEVVRDLQRSWLEILQLRSGDTNRVSRTTAELRAAVGDVFAAPTPGWTVARHVSPDLMIAASSAAAIARGDFEIVLGEVHTCNSLLAGFIVSQLDEPARLTRWLQDDLQTATVIPILPRRQVLRRGHVTGMLAVRAESDFTFEFDDHSAAPRERALRIGDLVVGRCRDRLEVRARDGRGTFDAVDFMGNFLRGNLFQPFAGERMPRVTVDGVVFARESWRMPLRDPACVRLRDPVDRFHRLRIWASELGLPRHVFVRLPNEDKPLYIDLESIVSVDLFAKLVRSNIEKSGEDGTFRITEMLPGPGQLWLVDAKGQHYASEIRVVSVDPTRYAREAEEGSR